MDSTIVVAIISFFGTVLGAFGGIYTSARITTYRISQLEKKVDKHNGFAERIPVIEEKIKVTEHRLSDLENFEERSNAK